MSKKCSRRARFFGASWSTSINLHTSPCRQHQDTPRVSVESGAKRQVEPGGVAVYVQRIQSISLQMSSSGLKWRLSETAQSVHAFV